MFLATESPSSRAWLLRSSGQSPIPARTAASTEPEPQGAAGDGHGAAVGLAGAEDGLDDLGAAGADQPGQAEHLARARRRS